MNWDTHLVRVLTLEEIHVATIDHVTGVDEGLSTPHSLQEVPRSLHFSHELDKELSTSVSVNCLHQTIDTPNDAVRIGKSIRMHHWRVDTIRIRCDGRWVSDSSGRLDDRALAVS